MATGEIVHPLNAHALQVFAEKGSQGGPGIVQQGNANGVKVRRAMQLTRDLATQRFDKLRILDLACGEGVYSIEAALRGAEVIAIDGRNERMDEGQRIASEAGLTRLKFELNDIRHVSRTTHGLFDVVYFLGILYHLDSKDAFAVLENIRDMLTGFIIIDTHIALQGELEIDYRGRKYSGSRNREHRDTDSEAVRRSRLLMSLDNPFSFWFTKESLVRLLVDLGFTSVAEVHAPLEPGKPENRTTLVARRGDNVLVSCYPWLNGLSEDEIARRLSTSREERTSTPAAKGPHQRTAAGVINGILRSALGIELRRVARSR